MSDAQSISTYHFPNNHKLETAITSKLIVSGKKNSYTIVLSIKNKTFEKKLKIVRWLVKCILAGDAFDELFLIKVLLKTGQPLKLIVWSLGQSVYT